MSRYIVRYGSMRSLGVMTSRGEVPYRRGNEVIVRTPRGLEVGQVLCEAAEDALSHLDNAPTGQVIRQVTSDDANEVSRIDESRLKKLEACQKHIDALGLEMKLVDVEQLFGGERMIVFYLAEDRVDFRELVKLLASEFQTRIEMKQIGVRDEAKLLADYGDCGKPVCCNNHLVSMPPVSMKMAKLQKATLDPTKISGRCGRLKCCLRYEFDHYDQSYKAMPRVGQHVLTRDGRARVIAQRVLLEQLLVETEDHRRIVIDTSEVLTVLRKDEIVDERPVENRSPSGASDEPRTGEKRRSSKGRDRNERNRYKDKNRGRKTGSAISGNVSSDGGEAGAIERDSTESDSGERPDKKPGKRRRRRSRSGKPRTDSSRGDNTRADNTRADNTRADNTRADNTRGEKTPEEKQSEGSPARDRTITRGPERGESSSHSAQERGNNASRSSSSDSSSDSSGSGSSGSDSSVSSGSDRESGDAPRKKRRSRRGGRRGRNRRGGGKDGGTPPADA